jgi:hypothetical protein
MSKSLKYAHEEGFYCGVIIDWGFGKSSKDTPQWVAKIRITGKSNNPNSMTGGFTDLDKPFITNVFLPFTGNAIEFSGRALRSLGYTGTDARELDPAVAADSGLKGHDFGSKEVYLVCEHDEWNGKPKERFTFARKREELTSDQISDVVARFGAAFEGEGESADEYFAKKAAVR